MNRRTVVPLVDDKGFVTLWLLGLCVIMLFVGGISLDLWRAFSERRALAGMADAAALAGASGIDRAQLDAASDIVLDPQLAERLALETFPPEKRRDLRPRVEVRPDRIRVTVTGTVDYTLLKVFLPDKPFVITVDSVAAPYKSR